MALDFPDASPPEVQEADRWHETLPAVPSEPEEEDTTDEGAPPPTLSEPQPMPCGKLGLDWSVDGSMDGEEAEGIRLFRVRVRECNQNGDSPPVPPPSAAESA